MTLVYPVILTATNDKNDTYLIEIPDLKGLTEGYGLADAISMARDYIGLRCYSMTNKEIPKASKLEEIDMKKAEFRNEGPSLLTLVDVDIAKYRRAMDNRSVRKNVSLPGWLSDIADEECINVSRVLQDALMETLHVTRESYLAQHGKLRYKAPEASGLQVSDNVKI